MDVLVVKGKDPYHMTRSALERFPLDDWRGKRVLIKPNAGRISSPGSGITTHPSVVGALIDHLRERNIEDILVGESCIFGVVADEAFRSTGLREVCEGRNVDLLNLDSGPFVERHIPDARIVDRIKVSSVLEEVDVIVSVPVMKTHMHTVVSLSLKNMKGALWRGEKARLHQLRVDESVRHGEKELDIAIVDIVSTLFPTMSIIDGTTGMEGMGPAYGRPKEAGIVVLGKNAVSVDAVASRLMGIDPETVPHLRLAAEKGLGRIEREEITVEPPDYLNWTAPFQLPPSRLSFVYPGITVCDEGACSGCISTLFVFLEKYHSGLIDAAHQGGNIVIGIGKHSSLGEGKAILIGNCTHHLKNRGIYVQGCPPVASQIWQAVREALETGRKNLHVSCKK